MIVSKLYILIGIILLNFSLAVEGFTQANGWKSLSDYEFSHSINKGLKTQFSDVENINDLVLSCTNSTDFTPFGTHERYYLVDASIDEVWNKYLDFDLKSAWTGKTINYGFAYCRASDKIFADNNYELKPQAGYGLFLELKIAKLLKILVAFEVSCIDNNSKVLQFTYLKRNKSNGRQTIIFKKYGKDKTLILHQSYFKSEKKLRDRYYPVVHKNLIDEFHEVILGSLASYKTISRRKMNKNYVDFRSMLKKELEQLSTQHENAIIDSKKKKLTYMQ